MSRVRELTGGGGVRVVYDSVGRSTWDGSLDCLRPAGLMVSFGNASGPVPPISPLVLSAKGSLFLTRPTLMTYTATREELVAAADELFAAVADRGRDGRGQRRATRSRTRRTPTATSSRAARPGRCFSFHDD